MNSFSKKAFCYGKYVITLGFLVFIVFAGTKKVLAAADFPYLIKVNRYQNTITVYEKDMTGDYSVPIKAIVCSVGQKGTETVLGTFQTKGKYRWKALMGDVWGQYSTRIVGGILFHSVYYYENGNPASLSVREYNKLGAAASHGCIRMTVMDAKWIYDNCPVGTTVIIYDDKKSPGPLGKPEAIKIKSALRWDPTDPSNGNPYWAKAPTITGAKNKTIKWGKEINLMEGIKAKSSLGTDITKDITIEGSVDRYKAGTYKITYSVTDLLGRTCSKKATITVGETDIPRFVGVRDQVVSNKDQVTDKNALKGVKVFRGGELLKKNEIEVVIVQLKEKEYEVDYQVYVGEFLLASQTAKFLIDDEAPVISGISDRVMEVGLIPDSEYALMGVSITDNYTIMDTENIQVTIEEVRGEDSSSSSEAMVVSELPYYLVTYEAMDEVGNKVKSTVHFHY